MTERVTKTVSEEQAVRIPAIFNANENPTLSRGNEGTSEAASGSAYWIIM